MQLLRPRPRTYFTQTRMPRNSQNICTVASTLTCKLKSCLTFPFVIDPNRLSCFCNEFDTCMVTVCPPFPVGESQSLVSSPASSVHDVRDTPESHIVAGKPTSEKRNPVTQSHKSIFIQPCVGTLYDLSRCLKRSKGRPWSEVFRQVTPGLNSLIH